MNIRKIALFLSLLFLTMVSQGQTVLKITEQDRDGNYLTKNRIAKASYIDNKIVDINSVLKIDIDKTTLTTKIASTYAAGLPEELAKKDRKATKGLTG